MYRKPKWKNDISKIAFSFYRFFSYPTINIIYNIVKYFSYIYISYIIHFDENVILIRRGHTRYLFIFLTYICVFNIRFI